MKTSLQRVKGISLLAAILLSAAALPTFAATSTMHTSPTNGHRYQADYTNRNWTGAISSCQSKGAHLVTLSNNDDLAMITDVIAENPNLNYTLGTYQSKVTGTIVTITGEPAYLPPGYMMSYIVPSPNGTNITPYRLVASPYPWYTNANGFGFTWYETFSNAYICEWD